MTSSGINKHLCLARYLEENKCKLYGPHKYNPDRISVRFSSNLVWATLKSIYYKSILIKGVFFCIILLW